MKKIRLGLVGAGWVAEKHLEVIQAIEGLEAVGITSRTRSKAEALAGKFGIKECTDDLESLVKKTQPDALLILVKEDQMFKVADRALDLKLPLFIEKPAGLLPAENLKLAEKAKKNSIPSMVGFNRRYYSIFHKGIDIIRAHGRLLGVLVEGHERMWIEREEKLFSDLILNNWLYANSVHTIDLLPFFGGEVENLTSLARSVREPRGDQFGAVMGLGSGAIGQYISHWFSPGGWRVVLYGEGVTVEFKPLEKGRFTDTKFVTQEIEPDELDLKFKAGFFRQMEAFGRSVRDNKMEWPALDLMGAFRSMELAEKLSSSVRSKI